MIKFQVPANECLSRSTNAFYHVPYTKMGNPGNPDYLNTLKNTFNSCPVPALQSAVQGLRSVLQEDIPKIFQSLGFDRITVCVVPRAKAENTYQPSQQLFRATVQAAIAQRSGFADGI